MAEVFGIDTRWLFVAIVGVEVAERVLELILSRRNAIRTLARGGVERFRSSHLSVVGIHIIWLLACVIEVWLLDRPWIPSLAAICLIILVLAMGLRYWAVTTLGDRWNTRIIVVPGEKRVKKGPYRWFKHPNYLALYAELFALPLLHTAWLTTAILAPIHVVMVWAKSRSEDRALRENE